MTDNASLLPCPFCGGVEFGRKAMETKMKYRETMRAEQAPDVYDGTECDQHRPRWVGSAEGDKEGDGPIGETIDLAAKTFPPGTRVIVLEPVCPECGEVPASKRLPIDPEIKIDGWECGCDFDWKEWAEEQFS